MRAALLVFVAATTTHASPCTGLWAVLLFLGVLSLADSLLTSALK